MKQRRYRQRPISVHVHLDIPSSPRCPFCHEPYDRVLPVIGGNGVDTAYLHDDEDDVTFHFAHGVFIHEENGVDIDDYCLYEVED
jgi:hypothetical protein